MDVHACARRGTRAGTRLAGYAYVAALGLVASTYVMDALEGRMFFALLCATGFVLGRMVYVCMLGWILAQLRGGILRGMGTMCSARTS